MEVMNLKEQEPVLFLPLHVLSDPLVRGYENSYGVDLNFRSNPFFAHLFVDEPDEELLSLAMGIAADRADEEPGIVLATRRGHLTVIAEKFQDATGQEWHMPLIFNGRLETEQLALSDEDRYYRVYCQRNGAPLGGGFIVYDPTADIMWNDEEQDAFRLPYVDKL